MSAASMEWTPLPLVVRAPGGDASLHVPEQARAYLKALPSPSIHVLGVTGHPDSGKKLLLRTLLHADSVAFNEDATKEQGKVLLWMWTPPSEGTRPDNARVVVSVGHMDVDDEHRDRRHAMALLLLLSSVLLYNDDGEIDAAALERLSWLRDIASMVRIKPNQDDEAVTKDFHLHAPKLVWVQQNAKVKWLNDVETGDKLTPTQYMERCLADEGGFSEAVMQRNAQRMYVHQYFTTRECIHLSRAVEASDPSTELLSRDVLRTQFVEAVDKIYTTFLSPTAMSTPAKSLLGREVQAREFPHVVDAYVRAINNNVPPAIVSALNALTEHTLEEALGRARLEHKEVMQEILGIEAIDHEEIAPIDARRVRLAHLRGIQRVMTSLEAVAATLPEKVRETAYRDGVTALRQHCTQQVQKLQERNASISKELCDQLLQQKLPATLAQIAADLDGRARESFSDGILALLIQYKSDLRDAVDAYETESAGPAVYESLSQALQAGVMDSIKSYGATVLRQYQQHMRNLQEEKSQLDGEMEAANTQDKSASFSAEDQKRLYEEQLEQSTQQLSELRRVLHGELNAKKAELDRLLGDMSTMDAKHNSRVKNMESDLEWVRSRTAELEKAAQAERDRLDQALTGATQEMIEKERSFHQEERSLMTQHKELLDRVVELERELVQKKTKHVQHVFVIESEQAKRVDELKAEQAEFSRQLKSQAKTDTGVLKLAYQKKKSAVQSDIDRVNQEIQEFEAKLQVLESVKSPKSADQSTGEKVDAPVATSGTGVVAQLRTSSREFLFKSVDSPRSSSGSQASGKTRLVRSDTEMCKAQ